MKARITVLTLGLVLVGVAPCFAQDAQMGTWKLNEAKSKIAPGTPRNTKVICEAAGDNVKVKVDGIGSDGKPTHNEWTGKFDGKDYKVTGTTDYDTRSYIPAGKHSLSMTIKKGDKTVITGKVAIAPDGKTRTVTTTGSEPSMNNEAVYDKQ